MEQGSAVDQIYFVCHGALVSSGLVIVAQFLHTFSNQTGLLMEFLLDQTSTYCTIHMPFRKVLASAKMVKRRLF